jgi:hypothetical protein
MTAEEFRRVALSFSDAIESSHQHHPDFRVHGRMFATLGYPDAGWAMVKLTPSQQVRFVAAHGDCFRAVNGGWGRRGATNVNLFALTEPMARRCLALAHRNAVLAQPRPQRRSPARDGHVRTAKRRAS